MTERPEQESGFPRKSTGNPPVSGDGSLPSDKDARRPTQETPEGQKSPKSVEFENMKERPVQQSNNATSVLSGKEVRRPTQESPEAEKLSPGSSKEESMKEKPIPGLAEETAVQESEETSKKEDESRGHPARRVDQDDKCSDDKGSPEEALPTQETMATGKGPFEETGPEVGVKGHPTD